MIGETPEPSQEYQNAKTKACVVNNTKHQPVPTFSDLFEELE